MRLVPLSCVLALFTGCLDPTEAHLLERDGAVDPSARMGEPVTVAAQDARGASWAPDALPRRPELVVSGASSPIERPALFLFEGIPDSTLLADLGRWPLLVETQERLVSVTIHTEAGRTWLVPDAPLELGHSYVLGVGSWALNTSGEPIGEAHLVALRVAEAAAGAVVVETWPAAGTYGVPISIQFVAIRFDDAFEGLEGIRLVREDGEEVPANVSRRSCASLLLGPGECAAIVPAQPLPERSGVRVEVGAGTIDRTGAPIGPFSAWMRTAAAADPLPPPALEPLDCHRDENALGGACALATESRVDLRARASAPVRVTLAVGTRTYAAAAPRGDLAFTLDELSPGESVVAALTIHGLDGATAQAEWALSTEVDLARVSITEIRADPNGAEPDQEYVEVRNGSDAPIDLGGFRITDDPSREGDAIAGPALLPAQGYALLVGAAFDPDSQADDLVPPGTPLFRLDASIATGGLANEGEPLFLRDASGRRVSAAPSGPAPAEGVCLYRSGPDARTGVASAFAPHPERRCGPGRADGVPSLDATSTLLW